ncbi:c-type cytochrome [Sulfurovum sp. bin170]|uniref:c-type cytochrome n=1 Tax=Sulfurovum sp. bin170 TaxID=2695268 RepID=UPI0013E02547|nr:c-type cytochrome [Sulfurovum sp. bin170]NEW61505.1 c-type cytochrome [Sulfurovum sp. bin170]
MFMLDHKKIISTAIVASAIFLGTANAGEQAIDGGAVYKVKDGMYTSYAVNTQDKKDFKYGKAPSKTEIAAWDIDVMPDGTGLPEGKGSVERGDELYEAQCGMCHGDFGSGGEGSRSTYPTLSVGSASTETLTNQRNIPDADGPKRVIGTYWPYASTLFWYIQSGMPFTHPKSLSDDDTYALVAYMLSINEIEIDGETLEDEFVLDRAKFLKIKMPNVDGFIPNIDGPEGPANIKKFLNDPNNYGNGTRCMKDCLKGKANIVRIKTEINAFEPPMSVERSMKEETSSAPAHPGKKVYEASCSVCHATDAMGAPDVGNKKAWDATLKKGIDKVYANGMNGINAMPPKGGAMDLTEEQFKAAVDYMIDNSK